MVSGIYTLSNIVLYSGDELFLEPMSGELKPNTHCNIKMTLLPGKYPCNFEGEIQCSIDWESEGGRGPADEARSVATNTNVPEVSEYLFIRLKKRAKIVSKVIFCSNQDFLTDQNASGRRFARRRKSH